MQFVEICCLCLLSCGILRFRDSITLGRPRKEMMNTEAVLRTRLVDAFNRQGLEVGCTVHQHVP